LPAHQGTWTVGRNVRPAQYQSHSLPDASTASARLVSQADQDPGESQRREDAFLGSRRQSDGQAGHGDAAAPPGDIFQAPQRGFDYVRRSEPCFFQIARRYYLPGWHQPAAFGDLFIDLDAWNGPSAQLRNIPERALGDVARDTLARGRASQATAMRRTRDRHQ